MIMDALGAGGARCLVINETEYPRARKFRHPCRRLRRSTGARTAAPPGDRSKRCCKADVSINPVDAVSSTVPGVTAPGGFTR